MEAFNAFTNGQTIDGVVLITGDRILIKAQTALLKNGVYTVNATGSPTRALDMDVWAEVPGSWVTVQQGAVNADTVWLSAS
jgi:phage-related tail fiber protein